MALKRLLGARWPILVLLTVLASGLSLAGYGYYRVTAAQFRLAAENDLTSIASLKVAQIAQWRSERLQDGLVLASSPWLARATADLLGSRASKDAEREFMAWLESARQVSGFTSVGVFDSAGVERFRLGEPASRARSPVRIAEALRTRRVTLTDLHRQDDGDIHMGLLVPVLDPAHPSGPAVGVLSFRIDPLLYLYPLIRTWPGSSPTAETLLVRREGESVLFLNELRFRPKSALSLRLPLSSTPTPAVRAVLGHEGVFGGVDYRGVTVLAAVKSIPDSPWFVVAKVDADEVDAPLRQRVAMLVAQIATLAVAAAFAALFLFERQRLAFTRQQRERDIHRRALEGQIDLLTRYANDIILHMDQSGAITEVNERAIESLGYSREELLGLNIRDVRAPGSLPDPADLFRDARPLHGSRFETVYRRKDGGTFPVDVSARVIDAQGRILVQAIVRDITDRKAAEQQIARVNRLYALLSEVNEVIVRLRDRGRLLDEVCRIAVELGGFRAAWVGVVDESGRFVVPTASFGIGTVELSQFPIVLADTPEGEGPCSKAIRLRRLAVSLDLRSGARPGDEWRAEAARRGYRAGAAVPLVVGSRVVGAFNLYASDPAAFEDPELKLIDELGVDLSYALDVMEQDAERARIEQAHRDQEEHYRLLFESSPFPMWVYDPETLHFLTVNDQAVRLYGYTRGEFLRMTTADIAPPDHNAGVAGTVAGLPADGGQPADVEVHRTKDGTLLDVEVTGHPLEYRGRAARMVAVNDVTERRRLEDRLRQSQKMEAVGRLAGGIAHDFNNLLTAITGYAELSLNALPPGDPLRSNVEEIKRAGDRAADLTRQLLAFSRKQILQPRILDLNQVVSEIDRMLRRLIGEDIELRLDLAPSVGTVRADRVQVEQVLLNLAVNGRDAMPRGGRLTIATRDVDLDDESARRLGDVPPGRYVRMTVADTGNGIPADVRVHLFEPFFTTKDREKGTGLGLSTVYGIVKQTGGFIRVESEPGRGATFTIDLPREANQPELPAAAGADPESLRGSGTILLAEDDPSVRALTRRVLERYGYAVTEASDGREALAVAETLAAPIDLLLTDVVMPNMGGRDLQRALSARIPGLKVLFMTGYAEDAIVHHGVLDAGLHLIQKPFKAGDLARKVREVMRGR